MRFVNIMSTLSWILGTFFCVGRILYSSCNAANILRLFDHCASQNRISGQILLSILPKRQRMLLIFLCVNNKDVNRSIVLRCLVCVVISSPSTVQMLFCFKYSVY